MRLLVVFNLKSGIKISDYELWAKSSDIPIVSKLESVSNFNIYRSKLFGSKEEPPYSYVELIDVNDEDTFQLDVATPKMQEITKKFLQFADNPKFLVMQDITELL